MWEHLIPSRAIASSQFLLYFCLCLKGPRATGAGRAGSGTRPVSGAPSPRGPLSPPKVFFQYLGRSLGPFPFPGQALLVSLRILCRRAPGARRAAQACSWCAGARPHALLRPLTSSDDSPGGGQTNTWYWYVIHTYTHTHTRAVRGRACLWRRGTLRSPQGDVARRGSLRSGTGPGGGGGGRHRGKGKGGDG